MPDPQVTDGTVQVADTAVAGESIVETYPAQLDDC